MKLKVDQDVCIGCGACQAICPNAFEIDDNGYATTIVDEISEEIRNAVDYIVDYRRNDRHPAAPSSIIKLGMGGEIEIIRK